MLFPRELMVEISKYRRCPTGFEPSYSLGQAARSGGLHQRIAYSQETRSVRICRTVDRQLAYVGNRPLFKLPKGRKTRIVPISRGLLEVIDDYLEDHPPVTIMLPWGRTTGDPVSIRLLIVNDAGGVDTGCEFNWRHWRPAFSRAGFAYVEGHDGMHALRHFYASTLLARGVTVKELAEYLGHSDPGFTLRTYTHLLPSSHEQARRAVDSVFKPRRSEKVISGPGTA